MKNKTKCKYIIKHFKGNVKTMVSTKSYKGADNFVSATNSQEGDKMTVKPEAWFDSEQFEGQTYLMLNVHHERLNKDMVLRVGKQNASSLEKDFGADDTDLWTGLTIEVIRIMDYPTLGAKGLLLKGIKKASA
jgi:hypothetical protein